MLADSPPGNVCLLHLVFAILHEQRVGSEARGRPTYRCRLPILRIHRTVWMPRVFGLGVRVAAEPQGVVGAALVLARHVAERREVGEISSVNRAQHPLWARVSHKRLKQ